MFDPMAFLSTGICIPDAGEDLPSFVMEVGGLLFFLSYYFILLFEVQTSVTMTRRASVSVSLLLGGGGGTRRAAGNGAIPQLQKGAGNY